MKSNTIAVMMLAVFGVLGCSLITDFDEDLIDGVDGGPVVVLYSLKDNIGESITVGLNKNKTGVVVLSLATPLPGPDGDDLETLQSLIEGGIFTLEVENEENGTTVSLLDGTMVQDTPNATGEYRIQLDGLRQTINIDFYNDVDGKSLYLNKDYRALIEMQENEHDIKVEAFVVDVITVSGS